MKKLINVFVLIASATIHSQALAKKSPSFDCGKASTDVEKAICKSDNLIISDQALSAAFKKAKEAVSRDDKKSAEIKSTQQAWAVNRHFCMVFGAHGETESCLKGTYQRRFTLLKKVADAPESLDIMKGELQPFTCQLFGSWQTHWQNASADDAKKLYSYIAPELDSCWKTLEQQSEKRSYYARNFIQLALQAGIDCSDAGKRFDQFALSQNVLWSLSTEYFGYRLKCGGNVAGLSEELKKRSNADRAEAEVFFNKLKTKLESSPQWPAIAKEHQHLSDVFTKDALLDKVVVADQAKTNWATSLKIAQDLPRKCGSGDGGCRNLVVGPKNHRVTIQVHFVPNSDYEADIKSIEIVDASGKSVPAKLSDENDSVSRIDENWEVGATDCNGDGTLYLTLGHSTAKFPYWSAYTVEEKTGKLSALEGGCKAKAEE